MTDKKNAPGGGDKKSSQPAPVSKDDTTGGTGAAIIRPKTQR